MVPMDIQIKSSDAVKAKLQKAMRKSAFNFVEDAKIVLVERGHEVEEEKISIVFDSIDYDEVAELLLYEGQSEGVEDQTIVGFSNNRYAMIGFEEIVYIEAQGTQLKCFTEDGAYSIKKTLNHYTGCLSKYGILRINKSQMVNMRNVKEIVPWFNSRLVFIMENGTELEVSKLYSKSIRKLLSL